MIKMIDVGKKSTTHRVAVAKCEVHVSKSTLQKIKKGNLPKGDVLTAAKLAGILAAKKTSELLPLCHPLNITHADMEIQINDKKSLIEITSSVSIDSKTGVEMEALTACSIAALTIYDMCKSVQKDIMISNLRLVKKTGGKSGIYKAK